MKINSPARTAPGSVENAPPNQPCAGLSAVQRVILVGLLSRAEVAQRLGVCPHTIQRLTRRGILPAIVFNRRLIRYSPDAVEAYIKAAAVGGIGEVP